MIILRLSHKVDSIVHFWDVEGAPLQVLQNRHHQIYWQSLICLIIHAISQILLNNQSKGFDWNCE